MTLGTAADESRKKIADGVARSPSRICSRDGKICCDRDAMSTNFLLACFSALLPTFCFPFFSFFLFLHFFPASRYAYLLRVHSSVQQPSATLTKYIFYSMCSFCLCHLYPTCKVTGRRHRVSPCRSAYFASPWWLLTLDLRRRSRETALLFPES